MSSNELLRMLGETYGDVEWLYAESPHAFMATVTCMTRTVDGLSGIAQFHVSHETMRQQSPKEVMRVIDKLAERCRDIAVENLENELAWKASK